MDDNDNSKESPVFKSTDILNTKAHNQGEYFVKTGKATLGQKFSSWSRKQKQKQNQAKNQPKTPEDSSALSSSAKKSKKSPKIIIIISVIVLAVAACALAIFFLDPFGWQKKEPTQPITYADIDQIFTDETTSTEEKISAANEKISTLESEGKTNEAFSLKSNLVRRLIEDSKDYNAAINYIYDIDEEGLSDEQFWECYNLLAIAHEGLGNAEKAEEYRNIADQYKYKIDAALNAEEASSEQE